MTRAILLTFALATVLLTFTPGALACSWSTPEVANVEWTEDGLFFRKENDLVHGSELLYTRITDVGPFGGFRVAPNGTLAFATHGEGPVGGMCDVAFTVIERWTPAGIQNVTDILPGLPLAIHWPSERGIFAEPDGNATIRDLATGEVRTTLEIGRSTGIVEYVDAKSRVHDVAWSDDGRKIALLTEDRVWMFRDDGNYLYDSYADFSVQNARADFTPDGNPLAVGWSLGDGFTELRLLNLTDPTALSFAGGYRDVRTLHAVAYSPQGQLAVALQEHPLYGDAPWGSGSLVFFNKQLVPTGNITWEGKWIDHSLSWDPRGGKVAVIIDSDIKRVDPTAATNAAPGTTIVHRDLLPIPNPAIALLIGIVLFAAFRRRRAR